MSRLRRHMGGRLVSGKTLRRNFSGSRASIHSRRNCASRRARKASAKNVSKKLPRSRCHATSIHRTVSSCKDPSSVPSCLLRSEPKNRREPTAVRCNSAVSFCRRVGRRVGRYSLARRRRRLVACLVNSLRDSNLLGGGLSALTSRLRVCGKLAIAMRRLRTILVGLRAFSPPNVKTHSLHRYLVLRVHHSTGFRAQLGRLTCGMLSQCFRSFARGH